MIKKGTALIPSFTAFIVMRILEEQLNWLVDYDFTSEMEDKLIEELYNIELQKTVNEITESS